MNGPIRCGDTNSIKEDERREDVRILLHSTILLRANQILFLRNDSRLASVIYLSTVKNYIYLRTTIDLNLS